MNILGISAFYHDSAAALIQDGKIVAAAQEERFNRKKHYAGFPHSGIKYCLNFGKIEAKDLDYIAFYDKPFLKFERLLETYLALAPRGFKSFRLSMPIWLKEKIFQKNIIRNEFRKVYPEFDWNKKLLFMEHHLSHAASAFFPSPFEKAAVLTMDGVGEWTTTSLSIGENSDLKIVKEIHFPHSIGLLYSAFTYYTGFKVNSGEYKLMGLAPYGQPVYRQAILENLVDLKKDGSFRLNLDYFDFCTDLKMTNTKFEKLFGGAARKPEEPIAQRHMDLAASVQAVTEEIVLRLTRQIRSDTGQDNLCLAGGVALNCVANGKILKDSKFKKIWVQPAAGDAGGALGAAFAAYHLYCGQPRKIQSTDSMLGSYLGPDFDENEIESSLQQDGANYIKLPPSQILERTVEALVQGKAVGWFQGRMEFGPRALGARSILGDSRSNSMQKTLNLKVKFRESFRPFAPSILEEDASEWFDIKGNSPYMLMVSEVLPKRRKEIPSESENLFGIDKLNLVRSEIPAVTHVDYSARIQTVNRNSNSLFHELLTKFKEATNCPILVNTSFNVRGEPIVCTPADAFRCFMGTGIEVLVIGNLFLEKDLQSEQLKVSYTENFELD